MIVELTVENLAIIERAQLRLGSGFTVLTGETGAGKSLLIDAIELVLGERADTEMVRTGAAKSSVSIALDLSAAPEALRKCQELGLELEEGTLFIHRDVASEGRSQCRIAGRLTPVSVLRQLGKYLIDLHGQHDHQSLLDSVRHVESLDQWIGAPAREGLDAVREQHKIAEDARRRLKELRSGMRDREHRLDLLRFQVNEIEAVAPQPGELEELESQLARLKYTERLAQATNGALECLSEGDGNAIDLLGTAIKGLEAAIRYDGSLDPVVQPLREALYQLEDGAHGLRSYTESLEADPATLEEVAARVDALRRLRRKYGENEAAILSFFEAAKNQLALLEDGEASEEELCQVVSRAEEDLAEAASRLSDLRKERAEEFGRLVTDQLRDLAMDRAVFGVRFQSRKPDAEGSDDIEFMFSANAGEPTRPLSRIASGGEISRVMLAIKTALAGRAGVPTLVFDEVDAGLGGRAAATVARKLQELGDHYQVLVISHLPQIAARANAHYRIEKAESDGRATTRVRLLEPAERVEEVARMLAGEQVTDSALANAREMMTGTPTSSSLFE